MRLYLRFIILIFSCLILQGAGHYFAHKLVAGKYFHYGWLLFRIIIPLILIVLLRIPFRETGLRLPSIDKKTRNLLFISFGVIFLLFIIMQSMDAYLSSYRWSFMGGEGKYSRFLNFMTFTMTTLTGWEFIHRGFLLKGLAFSFENDFSIDKKGAAVIAVVITVVFEVLFHFKKPVPEPAGLMLASPFLSYLVIRTGSIWPSFLIHFTIEIVFIGSLLLK